MRRSHDGRPTDALSFEQVGLFVSGDEIVRARGFGKV